MIYINDQTGQMDLDGALAAVSRQRRDHAMRYRSVHDRRLSVAAYQLLQQGLSAEYGITEPPSFGFGPHGKPVFEAYPHIHFSLSHCHEAAACVIASSPVGIDVESLSHYDAGLVPQVMNRDEQREIAASPRPEYAFIRLWTMKESLLKMTGEGMTGDMRHVLDGLSVGSASVRFHTTVFPGFICTVCYLSPAE